ncbi:RtcB family protein [Thermosipho ferrireducens]|uniref:tRNA-splicing ligase RtcB n=1 Tax=Thermosipho ferrireducens TaxID=2571116 RepID=A0ABX7S7T3_9BACT|nr:RtcB family protein [Thermosipho ferrireducens]QTA38647.1 RtcB family protein [Thermosipho ferrireducens]
MNTLKKISDYIWKIPKKEKMKVDAYIFTDEEGLKLNSEALEQIKNVASLPGIVKAAYGMPDIHWGYGFPIGGVAAFDSENGIISPGGVGFDINCGVRLLTTTIKFDENKSRIRQLIEKIYNYVPVGVGSTSSKKYNKKDFKKIVEQGAVAVIEMGFGLQEDIEYIEDNGKIMPASFQDISPKAFERGREELGTLGSGNHFLEIQLVERIYNRKIAGLFDLFEGQLVIMIHTGSRGFGHQIATDYIQLMRTHLKKHNANLPDKQLINAPFKSELGQKYYSAMNCAANYAFANRQIITHYIRKAVREIFNIDIKVFYDITHNIAKLESHNINGVEKKVIVHRKGATRAFGPGRPEIPKKYVDAGQPVIIPGDMGTASYILVGTKKAEEYAFSSTAHGAGRTLGRRQAMRTLDLAKVLKNLEKKNIIIISKNKKTIIQEAPDAYKDIDKIASIVDELGISKRVARLIPLAVIKG